VCAASCAAITAPRPRWRAEDDTVSPPWYLRYGAHWMRLRSVDRAATTAKWFRTLCKTVRRSRYMYSRRRPQRKKPMWDEPVTGHLQPVSPTRARPVVPIRHARHSHNQQAQQLPVPFRHAPAPRCFRADLSIVPQFVPMMMRNGMPIAQRSVVLLNVATAQPTPRCAAEASSARRGSGNSSISSRCGPTRPCSATCHFRISQLVFTELAVVPLKRAWTQCRESDDASAKRAVRGSADMTRLLQMWCG